MPDLSKLSAQYERQKYNRIQQLQSVIDGYFNQFIATVAQSSVLYNLPAGVFTLDKLPALQALINNGIANMVNQIEPTVLNGINGMWELANHKNDIIADIRLADSLLPTDKKVTFYDANLEALTTYTQRQEGGLGLSERIYNSLEPMVAQLEAGIGVGIAKGESAAQLGRELKQYLQQPDALFRRVRDSKGVLRLSKPAQEYSPGQGVYRSATKNIERLTRREINGAYRGADNARWAQMPFVLGYEVRTSGSHPENDICDDMAGEYPQDFVFTGWHPQCLCFAIPVLMSNKQFGAYQQLVLNGDDNTENILAIAPRIEQIPDSAKNWITANQGRVAGWKNTPYWWKDNESFVQPLLEKE